VILCDTGPMVAILDTADVHYERSVEIFSQLPAGPLLTTWPCIAEAMHILDRSMGWPGQDELWNMILKGLYIVHASEQREFPRMRELMAKYADAPMDLADASLVSLAEVRSLKRIMSFDDHFFIYRIGGTESFDIIR
jgi:predicted nucleic acid-binding protein